MGISLLMRAARAFAAATLIFSFGPAPSHARMGGSAVGSFARPAFGMSHFSHFAPQGFKGRFEARRFGFNRFGFNRFDRFGFNRFNRLGNQLFISGWGGWGGYSVPAAASEPIVVAGGPPVVINIGRDPAQGGAATAYTGGCVIHKLLYDSHGKYVGERQIPQC